MRDHQRRGGPLEIGKYNSETEAAKAGIFAWIKPEHGKPTLNYSYHVDAAHYARFLRTYAQYQGVPGRRDQPPRR